MAQRWKEFGGGDSDQGAAVPRNREWEELWGIENDWGEEVFENEYENEEDEREDEFEEQGEIEYEDEDLEWENKIEGNWAQEEEDWEPGDQKEEKKPEENAERKEDEEEEEEEEDSILPLEALRILDQLKDMNCPFLKGFYKSKLKTAKQFLCTPSIYRLDILAWLFTRLCPSFRESFDTWQDSNAEEKIIELTRLGHELMLCGPDDQDLIKGCTQGKWQLSFMNELINLIQSLHSEFGDNFSSEDLNICELIKKKKMMQMKIFNPDLSQGTLTPKPNSSPPNHHVKPLEAKKTTVEELSEKLTKLTKMLPAHKEEAIGHQGSKNGLRLPNTGRGPVQNMKADNKVMDIKVEQGRAYSSGGNRMVTLVEKMKALLRKYELFQDSPWMSDESMEES